MVRLRIPGRGEARVRVPTGPGADGADSAMERYSNGDDSAFAEVYDALAPRLLGYLRKSTRDNDLSEDLMQQTFLQIHRARGSFLPGAPVMPWAIAVAKRLMIDSARRRHLELRLFVEDSSDDDFPSAQATAATHDVVEARRVENSVAQHIDSLPETQRTAYRLVKQEGLSLKRAAELLGTTVPAVKLRTHRAYEALRALLREDGGAM